MLIKSKMGVMPEFNVINDWVQGAAAVGLVIVPVIAWVLHFALGAVWGALYTMVHRRLPGGYVASAVTVSMLAWLGMMIGFMPVAGNGLFALGISPMVAAASLMLHIVFAVVLGLVYRSLDKRNAPMSDASPTDISLALQ